MARTINKTREKKRNERMFYAITRFRKSSSRLNNIKRRYRFDIKFPAEKFQPSPNFDQYSETIPEHTAMYIYIYT